MNLIQRLSDWNHRRKRNPRPGLNGLDDKLAKYLNFNGGFFIEVGANDGYSQSNTFYLEKQRGWRGLLVEGIPDLYEKCRRERRRSIVHNRALVSPEFDQTHVTMHFAHLMSVVDGALKSSEEQARHLQGGVQVQKLAGNYSVQVRASTLESLLDQISPRPNIDFFSLDVEGYELQVLQGLNLARYRPTHLLVEARFFDEVNAFMTSHDYTMVEQLTFHDYLYMDRHKKQSGA